MVVDIKDCKILDEYKDQMVRTLKALYPEADMRDLERGVQYSMQKRIKPFNMAIQNNYTNQYIEMTSIDMVRYLSRREPITTSYGTIFRKHEDVPNPMAAVIDNFLKLRKVHKKQMFHYPKGSEMFEHYNLLQQLDKIDVNGIYGLIGLYVSILFDLNIAPAVTSMGRSLISSAILCFEGFLGNNVKFGSLNDMLTFIDNVRMEHNDWQFNDWEILGSQGFISVEECFNKIIMNCGWKYIPSYDDMNKIYKIIQNCNQIELNRLFYKNNLYAFMDLPIARNLMVKMITEMQIPYIEPAKPPKEIVKYLDKLRDLLVEYVFYNHQYIDRMIRNKEMVKTISVVSDTDSSFVSLDAWYNYNIAYLKDYDCPICHQQIDVFKMIEEEKNQDDYWWKDTETPEWYNAKDKIPAISFMKRNEDGKIKDSEMQAIEFLDNVKDFDFYNEEIIEQKRMIDIMKIIPQDNVKFALINIMCYILSTVINLYMIDFTKCAGSYRGDAACRINMKNEFYMSRIMLTDAKKHYASLQILQEGNYLGNGVLDVKGIDCLTKSSTSRDTQKALKKILLEDILTGDTIDQMKLIKDIAILEKEIYTDLRTGSKKYYKPAVIKSMDNYETPTRIQGVKAAMAWNHVKGDLPGFDLGSRNPLDVIKVNINKKNIGSIKEFYPENYDRLCELLDPQCNKLCEGLPICNVFHGKLDTIALPKDIPVPDWLKTFIDYDTIISDNLSGFPASSAGIGQFMSKKANYSNVVRL